MPVLVTAASKYGATAEIAQAIGLALRARGLDAVVTPPDQVHDVGGYDAVVLGSAVYAGRWQKPALDLVQRCAADLRARPVWLFSSGPVGDPSRKLVQKMGADPVGLAGTMEATRAREHRMFAGRLERRQLTWPQRAAVTVVRGLEGDFRDWDAIRRWAVGIADELEHRTGLGGARAA